MPRAGKRCTHRGCDNPQPCPEHRRKPEIRTRQDKKRRAERYDQDHRDERARWVPVVKTGTVPCRRASNGTCREPAPHLLAGDDPTWQLGHPDLECPAPRGPEHRRCNAATRGREERTRA